MTDNNNTQTPPQVAKPDPALKRLEVFVGMWTTQGPSYAEGQSVEMTSKDTFEWLPGEFFLVHRWDGRVGDAENKGMEVIGYDASRQEYVSHFFDNGGNAPTYQVTYHDGVWTYVGERQRSTYRFRENGDTMTTHWDWSRDGSNWLPSAI